MEKKAERIPDLLALDFDGVIADSIAECMIVGYNAHAGLENTDPKVTHGDDIEAGRRDEFKRLRRFIRSGQDYVYIFLAIDKAVRIENQDDFDEFLQEYASRKNEFHDAFYRERERLFLHHRRLWTSLNPLYPGMTEFLKAFYPPDRLHIITTKPLSYVYEILKAHGIRLRHENCFQAGGDVSKAQIITDLLKKKAVAPSRFHFIDDQIDTLIKAARENIRCYLAGWGYNDQAQKSLAEGQGIDVLSLEAFYSIFGTRGSELGAGNLEVCK